MFIDEHQAKQLHYDIMGVGLAVRGHAGECELYRFIDEALTALDWERMLVIRRGLALLPQHQQEDILSDDVAADAAASAIRRLERYVRAMSGALRQPAARIA